MCRAIPDLDIDQRGLFGLKGLHDVFQATLDAGRVADGMAVQAADLDRFYPIHYRECFDDLLVIGVVARTFDAYRVRGPGRGDCGYAG